MPNSSNDYPVGYISLEHKPILIGTFQGTSLLKPQQSVTWIAPIVQEKTFRTTWTFGCSNKLWMRHQSTVEDHSACICLENPCYTLSCLRLSDTSSIVTNHIQYFLQPMELYSIVTLMSWFYLEYHGCFGVGERKLNSNPKPWRNSDDGEGLSSVS